MSPGQQLHKLLAEVPGYEAGEIVTLLPYVAALQSALYARILGLQRQAAFPDTDYLLNMDEIATPARQIHQVGARQHRVAALRFSGRQGPPLFRPRP